jgi:hypothetical protein
MPIDITAAGSTGTHSFRKTNVNLDENYFYYSSAQGVAAQQFPSIIKDESPWIVRNGTGTIGGITSGNLYYANHIDSSSFTLSATTPNGTAVDLTSVIAGSTTFNFPFVYSNILSFDTPILYSSQQAVKYYTNGTPLTGLTSGNTYYARQSATGFGGGQIYAFTNFTFTSGGQTGQSGPTLTQLQTAYAGTAWATGGVYLKQGAYQGYQDWTVPVSGVYEFTVAGAPGRASNQSSGGGAAIVKGRVQLNAGEIITIAVGQRGGPSLGNGGAPNGNWPAASGGTFVVRKSTNTPLFVAGGGASASYTAGTPANAAITTNGGSAGSITGGTGGNGAQNGTVGGAGGGFLSRGANTSYGFGGGGFNDGLVGGAAYTASNGAVGGFGGGAGSDGNTQGGPGGSGGYSGGAAGPNQGTSPGSFGGSYIIPSATQVATSTGLYDGANTFNGSPITNLNTWKTGGVEGDVAVTLVAASGSGITLHPTAADANANTNAIAIAAAGTEYHTLVPITLDIENNTINTTAAHGLAENDALTYTFTGTAPTPLAANTVYYVRRINDYTFKLSTTPSPTTTEVDFILPGSTSLSRFGKVVVNTATNVITIPSHGFLANQPIRYSTGGGTAIAPLQNNATYYVKTVIDNNNIQLSQSLGGPVIDLSSAGTGTNHSFIYVVVNIDEDSLYIPGHDLVTGSKVVYSNGGGTSIGGLTNGATYFTFKVDNNIIKITTNKEGTNVVNLTSLGTGNHSLSLNQVDFGTDTISIPSHGFSQGELVQYDSVGQTAIGGLTSGNPYYVILVDGDNIRLANTLELANAGTAVNLTTAGVGRHRILSLSKSPDGTYTIDTVPSTTTFTVPANGFVPFIVKTFTPRAVVDLQANNVKILSHGFLTGTKVAYSTGGGTAIGGLTNATDYYVINISKDHIQLASSAENAASGVPISLSSFGGGVDHTLTTSQINGYVTGSGTVSTASGSTLVNGVNTSFAKILKVGDRFRLFPPNITVTSTFSSANVSINPTNQITLTGHGFQTGDAVVYTAGAGSVAPTGLTSTYFYFVRRIDGNTVALFNTASEASSNTNRVVITTAGSGTTHSLVKTTPSSPIIRTITAIGSDTQITVNRPYTATYSSVSYSYQTFVYVRPQGYSLHRPFDGGVEMSVGVGTSYASIIRQTRKYFRYQSGKGIQTSFGINFKPTIDIESLVRVSPTTFSCVTRRPHGLINGLYIEISEARTSTGGLSTIYNGLFQVTVIDSLTFTCIASSTIPTGAEAKAYGFPQFNVDSWQNGAIRAGMFDSQNGMFFEFDGQNIYAVRRSSTQQIAGTAAALQGTEWVFGTGTTFTTQLTAGDYIVMRGQSYLVSSVISDSRITIKPEYKGSSGIEKEFDPGNGTTGVVRLADDQFVIQNHGFTNNLPVIYDAIDGTPIGGLINGRTYYVDFIDNNNFKLKATPDSVVDVALSSVGAGSPHSFTPAKSGIIITKTVDVRTPQANWSIDPLDGTGPTGYDLDLNKIQMAYMDYSWYGAGKIRYGFKTVQGEVQYVHEYIHNNFQLESYFRSGNLPTRYEVTTYQNPTYIPFLFHWGTSVIMDGKFDDDKAYLFSASGQTLTITGTTAKNFGSTAINLTNNQINIPTHGFSTGNPVQFVGLTAQGLTGQNNQNPAIVAQNPAYNFNRLQNSSTLYVRAVDANNITLHPTAADANATGGTNVIDITSQGNAQYTYYLYPVGSLNNTSGANYQPLLSLRLSPSVSSGLTGKLGDRDVINRMQLRIKELAVQTTQLVDVKVLINPRLNNLNFVSVPSPALSQVIAHTGNDTVSGGIQVYNFRAAGQNGTEQSTTVDISDLFELSNSILGGDSVFPDGPDILTIAVSRLTGNTTLTSAKLTWTEAQA